MFRRFRLDKLTGPQQVFLLRIGFRVQITDFGTWLVRYGA